MLQNDSPASRSLPAHSGCAQMQGIALFSYFELICRSRLFLVTHMHTFVSTDVGQIERLQRILTR